MAGACGVIFLYNKAYIFKTGYVSEWNAVKKQSHKMISVVLLAVLITGMGIACRVQRLETRNKSRAEDTETAGNVQEEQNKKENVEQPTDLYARSAVLMDADSGRVLFGKEADVVRPMASTTKIMTCIMALEYLKDHPDQTVEISDHAAAQPKVHLGMQKGEVFYIKDLLYSLMLESHNDSAVAVAEGIAGSVKGFVEEMNVKAEKIGCKDTHFITPNGLDAEDEKGIHATTAKDLAKIMRYCIMISKEKEAFLEITRTKEYQFQDTGKKRSFSCHNHNAFLEMMDGALSGKTGFTADAGYCYVGSLRRDERTFIVALLACGWPNNKGYKWKDTRKLMEYGLEHYQYQPLCENLDLGKIEVLEAFDPASPFRTNTAIAVHMDDSQKNKKILLGDGESIYIEKNIKRYQKAPVKKNEPVGNIVFYLGTERIAESQVKAGRGVEKRTWMKCLKIAGGKFLTLQSLIWYVKYI